MLRLKANKTSLYKLVSGYEALPPMRRVTFEKAYRFPAWRLYWTDLDSRRCLAFYSTCERKPRLSIEKIKFDEPQYSRVIHMLDAKDLLERGMVEEFTAAAERRVQYES